MKHVLAWICMATLAMPAFAQTPWEKAEARIVKLGEPALRGAGEPFAMPRKWEARVVQGISVPIPPATWTPVRLPSPPLKARNPAAVAEGPALASYREQVQTPGQVELPTKPLIKVPSIDVNAPLPIPILARPTVDRASLGDPAFDASLGVAMKTFTPTRDRPVPFVPLNLPDPFENARQGQLRNPPDESATPPVIPIVRPK